MLILLSLAVMLSVAFGMSETAQAGHLWHSFSVCKQTNESCQHCPNVCHSYACQMVLHLGCLDSTCDMYQHHAYYPECHGSYYFRPYNWENYAQDTALMLGLGHPAPYSEEGFRELKPTTIPEQPVIKVRHKKLPNLEALLVKQAILPPVPNP